MKLWAWLDMDLVDGVVLFVCDILALLTATVFWPNLYLVLSVYIFVAYHLFLAWLVTTSDRKAGLSLHVLSTFFTHLVCFVLVYFSFVLAASIGNGGLAFGSLFSAIRYVLGFCFPVLAAFERGWLFSGRGKARAEENLVTVVDPAIAAVHAAATGDDYEAWQQHLASRNPLSRKSGTTLKDEYEQFMAARVKARAAASSGSYPA